MKKEIIDKALRSRGMKRVSGETMEPIMPYLLADVAYQIYEADIRPLPLRHRMKQMSRDWVKRYTLFNRPIFANLTQDETCELTDWMDSVNERLSNEITMIRAKIMEALCEIPDFERRKTISSFLLCHIFAQYADCSYQRVYYTTKTRAFGVIEEPTSSPDLCYMRDAAYNMAMQYIKETPGGLIWTTKKNTKEKHLSRL